MLSAGTHHKRVPKNKRDNLEFRAFVLRRADENPDYRSGLIAACREDILFYINTFVWQFNPKEKKNRFLKMGPMVTWDYQDEAFTSRDPKRPGILWCIENDEDCLIEKSRDMGASWMCLLAYEWLWHFHPWNRLLCISRNEDMVDKPGEPKSLFWKVDHIHQHLPRWLMPKGWDQKKHRRSMIFENPENHSVLSGEASTGKAGVGDRCTSIFLDEFSQIKEDKQMRHRTADTTNSRIFNGTHIGKATEFYKLSVKPGMKKIVMHWSQHPGKGAGKYHYDGENAKVVPHDKAFKYAPDFSFQMDGKPAGGPYPGVRSPWYDKERERRGNEREIAMDLDIDPVNADTIFFDQMQINDLIQRHCCEPYWQGELKYDKDRAEPESLAEMSTGNLKLWMNLSPSSKFLPARYVAGADISQGMGATPQCFTAFNVDTGVKVIEYANPHIKPDDFAAYCVALCKLLCDHDGTPALFAWEAAGPVGEQFGRAVIDLGYRRVYYRRDDFDVEAEPSTKPGWFPNPKAKQSLLNDYRIALSQGDFENRSEVSLLETLSFKFDDRSVLVHADETTGDDPSGARTNHADRVIADALAWKMAREVGGKRRPAEDVPEEVPVMSMQWRRTYQEQLEKQRKRKW